MYNDAYGRMPSLAAYTKFEVDKGDRIKLSLLHGNGYSKLLQLKE